MKFIALVVIAIIIFVIIRHRSAARAITRAADRNVWAQASDTRYARYPKARPFGRKKGLK